MEEKENNSIIRKAAAISYDQKKDIAPKIIATGKGALAEQIIHLARANGIEIEENSDLAEILEAMEVDSNIPIEAYGAIAEILSYIYKYSKNNNKNDNKN